jgi:hypothetical protein
MQLDLVDEPECSMLALRVSTWEERDEDYGGVWETGDYAGMDIDEMRGLRDRLGELIAQVEAHDAALMADDDTDGDGA